MKLTAQCPTCSKTLAVGVEHAGKKIRCPVCKGTVQLPTAGDRPRQSAAEQRSEPKESQGRSKRNRRVPADRHGSRPARKKRPEKKKRRTQQPDPYDNLWDQSIGSYGQAVETPEQLRKRNERERRQNETRMQRLKRVDPSGYEWIVSKTGELSAWWIGLGLIIGLFVLLLRTVLSDPANPQSGVQTVDIVVGSIVAVSVVMGILIHLKQVWTYILSATVSIICLLPLGLFTLASLLTCNLCWLLMAGIPALGMLLATILSVQLCRRILSD